ncbi:hypothetical protein ACW5UC_25220 [Priestia aryabhattai]|uniref:hypothetical protein n=1 Tax=Priestia megaterium TaxID=1404 RepID=UPI003F9C732A
MNNMGFGNGLFGGQKASRTGDQIDAVVKGLRLLVANTQDAVKEFDTIEETLQEITNLVQGEPTLVMLLGTLKKNIDSTQGKVKNGLDAMDRDLGQIDSLTNIIQN